MDLFIFIIGYGMQQNNDLMTLKRIYHYAYRIFQKSFSLPQDLD